MNAFVRHLAGTELCAIVSLAAAVQPALPKILSLAPTELSGRIREGIRRQIIAFLSRSVTGSSVPYTFISAFTHQGRFLASFLQTSCSIAFIMSRNIVSFLAASRRALHPASPVSIYSRHSLRVLSTSRSCAESPQDSSKADPPTPPRPAPPTPGQSQRLSFWPFLFIFAAGTGAFALMTRTREGVTPRPRNASTQAHEGTLIRKKDKPQS